MDKIYRDYLNSKQWLELRLDILTLRIRCERCGSKKKLQVHHKHYKNIFNEEPEDLELLCSKCHKKEHARKKQSNKKTLTLKQKVELKKKKAKLKKIRKFKFKKKLGII